MSTMRKLVALILLFAFAMLLHSNTLEAQEPEFPQDEFELVVEIDFMFSGKAFPAEMYLCKEHSMFYLVVKQPRTGTVLLVGVTDGVADPQIMWTHPNLEALVKGSLEERAL